jgi:hypothetical protein
MAKAKKASTTKVTPKAAADLSKRAEATQKPVPVTISDQPQGDHTHLATPSEEQDMRKAATSDAARKAAIAAGKKDPLEKWGDPNAAPDSVRRAAMGG